MKPVTLLVIGAGSRGAGYARFALNNPDLAKVVGVAEPREFYRNRMREKHGIPAENVFTDWREAADRARFADAVIVATQDAMHAEPAVAFAGNGYHMLLEKPMAPNEPDCRRIVEAARAAEIIFAVCHVMRYTVVTRKIKQLVEAGTIGEVVSIQHLEPVGYWHQAHSFVRGNWGNEAASSPMLLAKSCHDLDWIRYIIGARCTRIASFGTLNHFRAEKKPAGAGARCLDCGIESTCPYSAKKIYLGRVAAGNTGWPVNVLTPDVTEQGVTEALRTGPYGRCVYACDNDVVDSQVVNMLFEGGKTASFTMTAFSRMAGRKTTLFGSLGELRRDGAKILHYDFLTDKSEEVDLGVADQSLAGGHGGGDRGLMQAFVDAVAQNEPSKILSGPEETLETHLMVFAAEKARRENSVVEMPPA